jgi:hypothetical protein
MIARIENANPESKSTISAWHAGFLAMLPAIRRQVQFIFCKNRPELRHDLIQEAIANCVAAYARLVELGKTDKAYPTALVRYAVGQVRAGRRVGNRLNIRDVMSGYAQHHRQFFVARLDRFDPVEEEWREILVADGRATPADLAASRIDFSQWLREMPNRLRRIAKYLATGESTLAAARRFALSPARISQLRHELRKSWLAFQGELPAATGGVAC